MPFCVLKNLFTFIPVRDLKAILSTSPKKNKISDVLESECIKLLFDGCFEAISKCLVAFIKWWMDFSPVSRHIYGRF